MDPLNHDPINEMYEFLAFSEALDDGLSPQDLTERAAAESRANLQARLNGLVAQLTDMIAMDEGQREELIAEARGLAPREAQTYCQQLSATVETMKETVKKQEKEFATAEGAVQNQRAQNADLVSEINKLRHKMKMGNERHAYFQQEVFKAGSALCQTIANPNTPQRYDHDGRYPSSRGSGGSSGPGSRHF